MTTRLDDSGAGPDGPAVLDEDERRLVRLLSLDLGRSASPYAELAEKLGWTEERVLAKIREFLDKGIIRRLGGVLVHQRSGFKANAMVVWRVEPDRLDEVGRRLGALSRVSHCYWRPEAPGWPYNLYTMVHAQSQAELAESVEAMAALAGVADWRVLGSVRELKKSSLEYFPETDS